MSRSQEPIPVGHRVKIAPRGKRGVYTAEYHYDGQHRRKSLHTTVLKIARSRAIVLAARIEEGTLASGASGRSARIDRESLGDAAKRFLESLIIEESTKRRYRCMVDNFVASCRRQQVSSVDRISRLVIDGWQAERRKVLKESTLHIEWNLVRHFLGWCSARSMMAQNPLASEKSPHRKAEKVGHVLELMQVERLLSYVEKPWRSLLLVLAMSGLRAAECCNLRKCDIDLANGWLHVVSREGARTKTKRSRKVPIHPVLRRLLEQLVHGGGDGLFCTPSLRTPIVPGKLNKRFLAACKAAEIPSGQQDGFTVRSLRHFFKSYCISQGVPREYVDEWQGHSRIGRAADLYVHTYDDESQRFIAQVNFDALGTIGNPK